MRAGQPRSPLFPYTTLFRSRFSSANATRVLALNESAPRNPSNERLADSEGRSEEHTSELQSRLHLVCRLLLEKKNKHLADGSITVAPPTATPYPHILFLTSS